MDAHVGAEHDLPYSGAARRTLVIASTPRSGSTLLCSLLWSTGCAGAPMEYLHPEHAAHLAARWGVDVEDRGECFRALVAHRTTPNGVVSLKTHFHQLQCRLVRHGAHVEDFLPDPVYVVIRRRDVLGQAISYHRAATSGRWDADDVPVGRSRYSFDDILARLTDIRHEDAQWTRYLRTRPSPVMEVTYEELVDDPRSVIGRILDFIGARSDDGAVPVGPPTSRRLADEESAAWRARFLQDLDAFS